MNKIIIIRNTEYSLVLYTIILYTILIKNPSYIYCIINTANSVCTAMLCNIHSFLFLIYMVGSGRVRSISIVRTSVSVADSPHGPLTYHPLLYYHQFLDWKKHQKYQQISVRPHPLWD